MTGRQAIAIGPGETAHQQYLSVLFTLAGEHGRTAASAKRAARRGDSYKARLHGRAARSAIAAAARLNTALSPTSVFRTVAGARSLSRRALRRPMSARETEVIGALARKTLISRPIPSDPQ